MLHRDEHGDRNGYGREDEKRQNKKFRDTNTPHVYMLKIYKLYIIDKIKKVTPKS